MHETILSTEKCEWGYLLKYILLNKQDCAYEILNDNLCVLIKMDKAP